MKPFFTAILLFLHVASFAQVSPPFAGSDSVSTAARSGQFPPQAHRYEIFTGESQELKLITRSALVITAVSAAGVATYAFGDEPLQEFATSHHDHFGNHFARMVEPLGRSGNLLPVSGAVYVTGLALKNPKLQRTGILVGSGLLLNNFVTEKLKDEFQRSRPNEATHNFYFAGGEGGRHHLSFPSGHTSTAFTFAASVATVYQEHKWVPAASYATATLVGLSRIYDNKHWATDVLAGAAVGILTAKSTNFILTRSETLLAKHHIQMYLAPQVTAGNPGILVGGAF